MYWSTIEATLLLFLYLLVTYLAALCCYVSWLYDDTKDKADILNRKYESTWTKEDKDDIPIPDGTPFRLWVI